MVGKIQLLQQLLSEVPSASADLWQRSLEQLTSLLADLQQRCDSPSEELPRRSC
jgi:hypothetical protein